MFDHLKLEYALKKHGISKQGLLDCQNWGKSTYYRKLSGENDWKLSELKVLINLGVPLAEIVDIFF